VIISILLVLVVLLLTPKNRRVLRRRIVTVPAGGAEQAGAGIADESGPQAPGADAAVAAEAHGEGVEQAPETAPRRAADIVLGIPAIAFVALLLFVSVYTITSTDWYCVTYCHRSVLPGGGEIVVPLTATGAGVKKVAAEGPVHARCAQCHSAGIVGNVFDRTRMVVAAFSGTPDAPVSAVVDSANCERCHRSVLDSTIEGPVRMSHAEPQESGMSCVTCHPRSGHVVRGAPQMTQCVECHDRRTAAAACPTCHAKKPSDAYAASSRAASSESTGTARSFFPVPLGADDCYACHRPGRCDSCHQVRMPHSDRFVSGGHAYRAAWDGKRVCYRCHVPSFCNDCHSPFAAITNHVPGWQRNHAKADPDAGCACHDSRRPQRKTPFCAVCHRQYR